MKKNIVRYKGFVIVQEEEHVFQLFTKDEYAYGKGYRTVKWETATLKEAKEFIDSF